LKVLVVVHGFPPAAAGGTEIYAEAHARTLHHAYGDDVVVLTREDDRSRDDYAVRSETRDGVRIVLVNNTFRRARSFEETYANETIGRIAEAVIDDVQPDVAHIHHLTCLSTSIVPSLASRSIPVVMTLHDYWLICHRGQLLDTNLRVCDGPEPDGCRSCLGLAGASGPIEFAGAAVVRSLERALPQPAAHRVRRIAESVASVTTRDGTTDQQARLRLDHMRRIGDQVTHFLAPSECLRQRFVRFGIPADRISLSRYGLDHTAFARATRAPRTPGTLRVGFFGSLMVSKAPHVLLEAAAD